MGGIWRESVVDVMLTPTAFYMIKPTGISQLVTKVSNY